MRTKLDMICEKYSLKDDIFSIKYITDKKIKLSIVKFNYIDERGYAHVSDFKDVILFKNKYKLENGKNNKYKIINNTCKYNEIFQELLNNL